MFFDVFGREKKKRQDEDQIRFVFGEGFQRPWDSWASHLKIGVDNFQIRMTSAVTLNQPPKIFLGGFITAAMADD